MKRCFNLSVLLLLCAVIMLSACLSGCTENEPNFPVPLSDTTRSALELNGESTSERYIEEIYQYMLDGATVNELNKKYEIPCLRKDEDGYHIIYWGYKKVLVLRFDQEGSWVETDRLHSFYRLCDSRGRFDKLKAGDSVSMVQWADVTAYFPFLADRNSTELETNHYSEDGYHSRVLYDADFNVLSVASEVM